MVCVVSIALHGMRRPGSKHPHGHQQNFCIICMKLVTDQPPTIVGYRAAIATKSLSVNLFDCRGAKPQGLRAKRRRIEFSVMVSLQPPPQIIEEKRT